MLRLTLGCCTPSGPTTVPATWRAQASVPIQSVELCRAEARVHGRNEGFDVFGKRLRARLLLGPLWNENGLMFPATDGKPWLPRVFYRGYRSVVGATAIVEPHRVDFHCLRHTAASQWIRHGVDVFTVSRRLGHASASFTMDVYSHLLKGQQQAAASALDHLLAAETG
jgi:integrase